MKQYVWAGLLAFGWSVTSSVANAGDILLAPLAGRNVRTTTLTNITSLIYSELDFNPSVSSVNELKTRPSTLNSSCIKSTSCLRGVAKLGKNEPKLLTGYVSASGGAFVLKMVLFDTQSSQILRSKSFTLGASPEALADGMTDVVKEILTGQNKKQVAEEETFDFGMEDEDDFDFEEPSVADAENSRRREEQARKARDLKRRRAAEAERKRQEEARREEELRRAEEDRRRREAEEARRRTEEERSRREAANRKTESEDFDPNAISFGSAAIIVDDEGAPKPTFDDLDLEEEEFLAEEDEPDEGLVMLDLDEDEDEVEKPKRERREKPERKKRERASTPTKSKVRTSRQSSDAPVRFMLAARGGYSPYFNLGFITYGAEAAVAVGETGLFVLGGVEAYSVQRQIPEEFQDDSGQVTEWNTIFPINVGLSYRILKGNIQPYVGADVIFAQYYVNQAGGSWAIGGRARAGANFMVSRNFGFNANIAVGFWAGKNWGLIEQNVKKAGILPQVSAGTVFAF